MKNMGNKTSKKIINNRLKSRKKHELKRVGHRKFIESLSEDAQINRKKQDLRVGKEIKVKKTREAIEKKMGDL